MEGGDYAGGDIVDPDPGLGSGIWVLGEEVRTMRGVCFFEELQDHGGFVEGLWMRVCWTGERRYETAWVQGKQRLGLVVGVDFDVLVRDLLFL